MPTLEELTVLVALSYLLSVIALALGLYLFCKYDEYRQKKRREKFKADIADEVCARVLGADNGKEK